MKVLVLSAKNYDFKNSVGESIKGLKLSYITEEEMQDKDNFGFPVMQQSISNSSVEEMGIKEVGLYDLDFNFKPGKNNVPVVQISQVKFIKKIDISNLFSISK